MIVVVVATRADAVTLDFRVVDVAAATFESVPISLPHSTGINLRGTTTTAAMPDAARYSVAVVVVAAAAAKTSGAMCPYLETQLPENSMPPFGAGPCSCFGTSRPA